MFDQDLQRHKQWHILIIIELNDIQFHLHLGIHLHEYIGIFFAIFLTFVGNGSKWILEKVEFYKQVEQTTVATTAVPTAATETTAAESDSETEASEDATETEATTTTSEETSSTAG